MGRTGKQRTRLRSGVTPDNLRQIEYVEIRRRSVFLILLNILHPHKQNVGHHPTNRSFAGILPMAPGKRTKVISAATVSVSRTRCWRWSVGGRARLPGWRRPPLPRRSDAPSPVPRRCRRWRCRTRSATHRSRCRARIRGLTPAALGVQPLRGCDIMC